MFSNYLIEVRDNPVGILVREGNGYAFHALESSVRDLEGLHFSDAFAAEKAARRKLDEAGRGRS